MMDAGEVQTLAEVSLEIARCLPDMEMKTPRAEWRWRVVELARECIKENHIMPDTEDIDEVVNNWLVNEGF